MRSAARDSQAGFLAASRVTRDNYPVMLVRTLIPSTALALLTGACAFAPQNAAPTGRPGPLPSDYAWPPKTLAEGEHAPTGFVAKSAWHGAGSSAKAPASMVRADGIRSLAPPASAGCLNLLDQAGVHYETLSAKRGVVTPVQVDGELGGIHYVATAGLPLVMDCRFAVTLWRIAPILKELGVSEMRYSGAYVYRMSSKGRLSLHANGLAIDVHEMVVEGQKLSVKHDFARGLDDGCSTSAPALNRVACQLKRTGVFRELLTPDYNADHHDHFHLAIAPAPADGSS